MSWKTWLMTCRDDILDEFATEALRRKLVNAEPSTSKVRKIIPACCVGFKSNVFLCTNMRSKIKDIDTRLQRIVTEKNDLQLTENTGGRTKTTSSRALTTSVVNEGHVYGRDEDKKAIVKLLLSAESSDAQLSVIPILGMGGMGKTTLVQLAYNDDDVNRYFDLKAWGCVSEDFNIVKVTKEIIQSVTSEPYDVNDLNLLQVKLKEKLSGKKFLVILDDVWNENYNDWTKLRCPFEFGAPGSKIVITTRNDRVSSTMGTTQAYMLKELSNDACLTVFTQNALGTRDFSAHPELEEVGRKISERCKGLPLAAKALGGLLRTIHDRNKWEDVLNNKIWDMSDENSDVLPTLKLSYLYLPSHLKRCFAYCSLFPKDYEFEEKELVLLWMAEGLVQETERKPMEELGCEHFHDLYRRSFFQQSSSNESLFVMHDLINDLARWAAGDSCYILEDTMGGNKQSKISTKLPEKIGNLVNLRHLDITDVNSIREMPVGIGELKSLQTLSNFVVGKHTGSKIGDLMNLKFLHGRLCISRLENVLDAEDARRANLNSKKNLDALAMKWGSADDDLQDARVAIDVFDMLRPWTTVKELSIDGYVGVKFPTWLGHTSFSNMVHLRIERCRKCTSLPAIGQLPSLKDLVIIGMAKVQSVGPEFYGVSGLKPFQSLETLHFEDMQEWKDWIPCGDEYEEFSCLRELSISHCPKLQGKLPYHLQSLEKFCVRKCEELVVSIPSLPMLHELEIVGCKEVVRRNTVELCSLKSIVISIPDLKSLTEEFMHGYPIVPKSHHRQLDVHDKDTEQLKIVVLCNPCQCPIVHVWKTQLLRNSVVDVAEAPSSSSLLINEENLNTSLLEQLDISNCPSLKFLSSRGDLPVTLKSLWIDTCSELTSLSSSGQLPIALKELSVNYCPKLESVADKLHNNVSLEYLGISSCEKLKSLPEGLHKLCHLIKLFICECSSLVSFPDGGLLPTSLRELQIGGCEKLEALPNPIHNLTNLTSLELDGVNICKQGIEWGLHRLTSLPYLWIEGGFPDWQSFPSEEEDGKMMMTLPTSLTTLTIWKLPNIVFLSSKGFQNLSALQQLEIKNCPKLEFLPEKGLPPSLLELEIHGCPLLKQHCKKDKGREWYKIANIPRVMIDGSYRLWAIWTFRNKAATEDSEINAVTVLDTWVEYDDQWVCIEWQPEWNVNQRLCLAQMIEALSPLLLGLFGKCRKMSKLEGKAVNASQALNYYTHMVIICLAANHSIRRSKVAALVLTSSSEAVVSSKSLRPILTNAHQLIESCRKCTSLPAIGQLPSLKDLVIIGMTKVESVGPEFYGESGLKPFQSLETLRFEDMPEWKDWIPCGDEYEEFSCLRELSIFRCPKLQGKLPYHLPSLEKFSVRKCEELVVSIPSLPMLHKLEIVGCKEVVENLTIDDCKEMTSMWQDKLMFLVTLDIRSCPSLITVSLMSTIRTLKIEDCSALKSLPMSNCTCLEDATITECNSLTFISRGQLPSTLKRLVIKATYLSRLKSFGFGHMLRADILIIKWPVTYSTQTPFICEKLKSLPEGLHKLCHLNQMGISGCSSLVSFPDGGLLPTSLRELEISYCEKLEALPNRMHNLTSLQIWYCGSIISFPEEGYPTNLTSLDLKGVNICGFPDWQSFPSEEEDGKMMMTLPTSLTTLGISSFPNIVSLSSKGFQNLSALQQLRSGTALNSNSSQRRACLPRFWSVFEEEEEQQ
uniref:Uncharacterized protein n=1 Tax=Fagus sylvatica TaxID=28930 RepID=A0A2N9FU09_FAGSY